MSGLDIRARIEATNNDDIDEIRLGPSAYNTLDFSDPVRSDWITYLIMLRVTGHQAVYHYENTLGR